MPTLPRVLQKFAQGEYPLPAFHFEVRWSANNGEEVKGSFTEVSGLNREIQLLEYRDGVTREYATVKIPGMRKDNNVTLKRGVFHGNNELYEWWLKVSVLEQPDKRTVTINLLGEDHQPRVTWTLHNAWILKLDSPGFKADGNDVAVESAELVFERMEISHENKLAFIRK